MTEPDNPPDDEAAAPGDAGEADLIAALEARMDALLEREPRYPLLAYQFVREALDDAVSRLPVRRHVSGRELLEALRSFALDKYGPMARTVLNNWGIEAGEDVGRIVFLLIEAGVLSKTDEDTLEDFSGVMRFDEEFEKMYRWP